MARMMTLREELLYKMHVFESRWEKFCKKNDLKVIFIGNEDFYKLIEKAAVMRAKMKFAKYWHDGGYEEYALKQDMYGSWNLLEYLADIWNLDKIWFEADTHARQFLHDAYNYELSVFNDMLHDNYHKLLDDIYREKHNKTLNEFYKDHRDMYCGVSERSITQAYDEYVKCGKDW